MSVVAFQVDIEAAPAHVWRWVADCESLRDWLPEVVDTVRVDSDPAPPKEGGEPEHPARFTRHMRKGRRLVSYAGAVTVQEPPNRLAVRLAGEHDIVDMHWRLCAFGTGTRLEFELTTSPATAWGAVCDALARAWVSRRIRRSLAMLKRLAEQAPLDGAALLPEAADADVSDPVEAPAETPTSRDGVGGRDQKAA